MANTQFKRTIEDFICERCGVHIRGTGYTNHCPSCLWSKHVDNAPGDRGATCRGMMKPTQVEQENGTYVLTHTCVLCEHVKRNKVTDTDNMDAVISLAKELAEK